MARLLVPASLAWMLACTACGPAPEDPARRAAVQSDPATTAGPAAPHAAESAPAALPSGDAEHYACGDGSAVEIDRRASQARVALPDGGSAILPKAQSASKGDGEVFVGDTISIQRDGASVALFTGAGERTDCRPAGATE